ncbi:hypothetical protein WDU94_005558 [Cyamophila willieti]
MNESFTSEENCEGDVDDTDTEEIVSERDGDSETDEDGESSDEGGDDSEDGNMYLGKDGITRWSKRKDRQRGRMASHNQQQQEVQTQEGSKRKRCSDCQQMKKVRYSKYKCLKCSEIFCLEHKYYLY